MRTRSSWVDFGKGVGICLVVYGHVVRGLHNNGKIISEKFYDFSDTFVYSFHMPLFFFLSGIFFIKSISGKNFGNFLQNKFNTLMYFYIIWSILQTSIEVILSEYTNGRISSYTLITCLIQPRAQFWFLFALLITNFINSVLYKINRNNWLTISFLVWFIFYQFNIETYMLKKALHYLFYFNLGILFSKYGELIVNQYMTKKNLLISVLLFIFSEISLFYQPQFYKINSLLSGITGTFLVCHMSMMLVNKKYTSYIIHLGEKSMIIFLMHIVIGSGIRIILYKMLNITDPFIHITLGTMAGIGMPIIIYNSIKNKKYLSWLVLNKLPINNQGILKPEKG